MKQLIKDLFDSIEALYSRCLETTQQDYLTPRLFKADPELLAEYAEYIVRFSRQLQKDLITMRRFASFSARSGIYTEAYYLRAYLHRHLLSMFFEDGDAYIKTKLMIGPVPLRNAKQRLVREFDILMEYLGDYEALRSTILPGRVDPDTVYVLWKSPKDLSGSGKADEIRFEFGRRRREEEEEEASVRIKYVHVDTPEGILLRDMFGVVRFPAVIYPAGGITLQAIPTKYAIKTIRSATKMDTLIDDESFKEKRGELEELAEELLGIALRAVDGEWSDSEILGVLRRIKRNLFATKKILAIEMGGFARMNSDLFAPVSALSYVVPDMISTYLLFGKRILRNKYTIRKIFMLALMLHETLGIIDFLVEFRPADIQPAYDLVFVVGHKNCPHCLQLGKKLEAYKLTGVVNDVRFVLVDALSDENAGAQFYQVVFDDGPMLEQSMPSPIAYYGVDAVTPDASADIEVILQQIGDELYEKLSDYLKKRKAKKDLEEFLGSGDVEGATGGSDVWEYGKVRLKAEEAVAMLRDQGFSWGDIGIIIAIFYRKRYSIQTLRNMYKKVKGKLEEAEEKKTGRKRKKKAEEEEGEIPPE